MNRLSQIASCLYLLVISIGCNKGLTEVQLTPARLEKGFTVLFRINETDSVISKNQQELRKLIKKGVQFMVMDTLDGFTISWTEHLLIEIQDSTGATNAIREWTPFCQVIYHCDRSGMIDSVLNYDEVLATIHEISTQCLDLTGVSDDPRAMQLLTAFMDSSWMISRLLTNAELIHRHYGITVLPNDTTELLFVIPQAAKLASYSMVIEASPLCENALGIRSWSDTASVDLGSLVAASFNNIDITDLPFKSNAKVNEEMYSCFDTTRSITPYLHLRRTMQLDTASLIQRIEIYEEGQ